jgi:SAM-dependent methyltransferase
MHLDRQFTGSIPELYERYMVPLKFAPYAEDLVRRVAVRRPARVLELAAGTGAVTRRLAEALPPEATLVATDLNPAMLAHATALGAARPVTWRPADAQQLPFADGAFDVVVCQFGVMFFPDRAGAFAEARRVLAPGGALLFNVWNRLETNEFAHVAELALKARLPADPPGFMGRTPHGYFDLQRIRGDLQAGGFQAPPRMETVTLRSRAASARVVAIALCQGTPLRGELEARSLPLEEATDLVAAALEARFGAGPVDGQLQAHVVEVERG